MAPLVREQTLKSILTIVNKLSDRTINGELLRHLAKTANDEQPGLRTNTTICLGKIAKYLGNSTRSKVLLAAFSRSLRDPFVHARNASLMALAATAEYFGEEDCAARVLPCLCPLLLDKEKLIRDQADKTIDVYLQKIRKAADAMPDSALPPTSASDSSAAPRMGTPQASEPASSSWAGWAISSFTNKLSTAAGEMQANGSTTPKPIPSPGPTNAKGGSLASASTLHRQAVTSPSHSMSRTSSSTGAKAAAMFQDSGDADDGADAWGDMDDDDDGFFDNPDDTSHKTKETATSAPSLPYDDGGEPDFAGWLAAQSQKKSGNKPLPKGLAKPKSSIAGAPRAAPASKLSSSKPSAAKKIDMKPKESDFDDDAWGDGW